MRFGELNPNWRADAIGYRAAHMRVHAVKGHAAEHDCMACGAPAHEWAYSGVDEHELTDERGRTYSPRVEHYEPMCRGCHRFNDAIYRRAARDQGGRGEESSASPLGRGRDSVTFPINDSPWAA